MATADIVGYCMKCKAKRTIIDGKVVDMGTKKKNAYKGKCKTCKSEKRDTTVFTILSAEDKKKLGL